MWINSEAGAGAVIVSVGVNGLLTTVMGRPHFLTSIAISIQFAGSRTPAGYKKTVLKTATGTVRTVFIHWAVA